MKHGAIMMLLAVLLPVAAFAQVRPAAAPAPTQSSAAPAAAQLAQPVQPAETEQPARHELSPAEYAAAFAASVAQNTELMEGQTGKAYLDDSYTDAGGKLHIVINQAAAMQFRNEWPRATVCVNIVNFGTCGSGTGAKAKSSSKKSGGSSSLGGQALNIPGLGALDPTDPDFINKVKQLRALNPEAFDTGFIQGFNQTMSQYDPATQELMKQLIPMSGGTSVEDALDKIGGLLDLYNAAPKY